MRKPSFLKRNGMAESPDIILWQRVTRSDYTAFNSIYEQYWDTLLHIALKKVNDSDIAMDLVQDLFVEMWQKRHAISIQTSLKAYLVSSLYFKTFMHFRRNGVHQKHIDNYSQFTETYVHDEFSLQTQYEENYAHILFAIERSVEDMPLRMKAVFQLKYYSSLNNQEIADNLGLSTQTVKNQLSKALTKIRQHMEAERLDTSLLSLLLLACFTYS